MIKLVSDENFDGDILRGLLRRLPEVDVSIARTNAGLAQTPDPIILDWAAEQQRILLTHDRETIPGFAYTRVKRGKRLINCFWPSNASVQTNAKTKCITFHSDCISPGQHYPRSRGQTYFPVPVVRPIVHRPNALVFSQCNSHPAPGSLDPAAIDSTRRGNETHPSRQSGRLSTRRADRP